MAPSRKPIGPRLFVGNVAYHISHETLTRYLLKDLGLQPVDIHLVCDHESGESKGYAFLEFRNKEDAEKALDVLNRALFAKRSLRANWATERRDKSADEQYSKVWANDGSRR